MTPKHIKKILYKTQNLMYGFNYAVTLGIELFENKHSLPDINLAVKERFPKSNLQDITPVCVSESDFWKLIEETFAYRGDNMGVSLKLTLKQEKKLKGYQDEIKEFVRQFINAGTRIYNYPYLEGIPGYPVFWEYSFILLNTEEISIFFYGSSSD